MSKVILPLLALPRDIFGTEEMTLLVEFGNLSQYLLRLLFSFLFVYLIDIRDPIRAIMSVNEMPQWPYKAITVHRKNQQMADIYPHNSLTYIKSVLDTIQLCLFFPNMCSLKN